MNNKDTKLIWEAYDERLAVNEDFGDGTPDGLSPSEKMRMAKFAADEYGKGPLADKDDRGVHGDRPDAGESLSDYDLKIVVGRDKELDEPRERYGPDTYEIHATSRAAREQFGDGVIDRIYVKDVEDRSIEELEQMVIQSLHNHGKPLFFRPYSNS